MLKENDDVIGRIIESTLVNAKCEFDSTAEESEAVVFNVGNEEIRARIDVLENLSNLGVIGYISFKDRPTKPPKLMTPIRRRREEQTGILYIGHDFRGNPVRIEVNPLYNHLLVAGKTQRGKTHLFIVLIEELAKRDIPAMVLDTQGECINLPEKFKNVIVVEDINTKDLIAHLQQRHIVVINMLGESNNHKALKLSILLNNLVEEKEKDYANASNDYRLLQIPPTLVMIDEADIFAPTKRYRGFDYERSTQIIEEIAKRGTKLGIGLIAATQRIARLTIDVRDNCNSTICFHVTGKSSELSLKTLAYFPDSAIRRIKSFLRGECIIIGTLGARTIKTRDIETRRSKNTDFETMLGIKDERITEEETQHIILTDSGEIVDTQFGKITSKAQRTVDRDSKAFEEAEGDGVLKREKPLTDEELHEMLQEELEYNWSFDSTGEDFDEEEEIKLPDRKSVV